MATPVASPPPAAVVEGKEEEAVVVSAVVDDSSPAKDDVFFISEEDEAALDIKEERAQTPLREDVGEAVGPDGKIDWDCPCLAGMTEGPCAEEFKAAFSCFVYSTEEEKGADCVPLFEAMHGCLIAHPEFYGTVDEGEEEEVAAETSGESGATAATEPLDDEVVVIETEEADASTSSSSSSSESEESESESEAEQSDA